MRKSQLRQYATRYLQEDNRGSFKDKKYCHYVIHKMIDDLFTIGEVPAKWHALTSYHLQQLVCYWLKKEIEQTTILKYLSVIRQFLKTIKHVLPEIDNHSLGITLTYIASQNKNFPFEQIKKLDEPILLFLLKLQIYFGMTLSEGMRFLPELNYQDQAIWLTRNITFNSHDRMIPLRTEKQKEILTQLVDFLGWQSTFISHKGYQVVCYAYNVGLKSIGINPRHSYRYFYAHYLKHHLSPALNQQEINLLLLREMGLKSRTTLWKYQKQYSSINLDILL